MRSLILICTLALMSASPAMSQEGNPGGTEPGVDINAADRVFVMAAAQSGMAEVDLAKLAGKRTKSDPVKEFADRMEKDHGKANVTLKDIAKKEGLALPKELDPEHQAVAKRLESLSGRQFDTAYMQAQVSDHQKAAQLLAHESLAGQNEAVKDFAAEMLPTVLAHLQMAQGIMVELSGQAAR